MTTKEKIRALPYSQLDLAIKLDVSINTVKSWTRTKHKTPSKPIMEKLEKLFKKVGLDE